MDKEEIVRKIEKGKVDIFDIDRDEDLMWAVADLYCIEKHLNLTINFIKKKLEENPKDEYYQRLYEVATNLLNGVRVERAKHLKRLVKFKEFGFWCQPAGSPIITNFDVKNIENIKVGDKVFGVSGSTSVIGLHQRKYNGLLYFIYPKYSNIPLVVSPEHPILVPTLSRIKQKDCWKKNLKENDIRLIWKPASQVTVNEFLVFPRVTEIVDDTTYTEDLMELIGIYLAEGCISEYIRNKKYKVKDKVYRYSYKTRHLGFFFGKHEKEFAERTSSLIAKVFGSKHKITKGRTDINIYIHKKSIVDFFKRFGRQSTTKKLPKIILKLPNEKLYRLLRGFILGDGHIGEYFISMFTSSETLAFQLRIILFKLGILNSIYKVKLNDSKIGGRTIHSRSGYGFEIRISGDSARKLAHYTKLDYDGGKRTNGSHGYVLKTKPYVLIPIKKIEVKRFNGILYNLTTNDGTYLTHTGLVHNCIYKHFLGGMMQFGEVGAKDLYMGDKENAKLDFETSSFCHDAIILLNQLNKLKKVKKDVKT